MLKCELRVLEKAIVRIGRAAEGVLRKDVASWNAGRANRETIESLFSLDVGRPQPSDRWDVIEDLCVRQIVRARMIALPDVPKTLQKQLDDLLYGWRYYRSGDHQAVDKIRALHWLQTRGATELSVEGDYEAGRYDVAAQDLGVVVECGTARAEKLLRVVLSPRWREFVLVPLGMPKAVVFDLDAPVIRRIREAARKASDPLGFLAAALREGRLSKSGLRSCLALARDA